MDNQSAMSTYWQRDMSFMRLKNAEIGYTLPKKLTRISPFRQAPIGFFTPLEVFIL
jgi:hypothetical protein